MRKSTYFTQIYVSRVVDLPFEYSYTNLDFSISILDRSFSLIDLY